MPKSSARMLIAAAAIGLGIGGAAAPIGVAPVQAAEHAKAAHSTPAQSVQSRTRFTPDQTRTGCHKYTPDTPEYRDCMAQ